MGMMERLSSCFSQKRALFSLLLGLLTAPAWGSDIPEYQLKAAYLYNFASFTKWPVEEGAFQLCVFGKDPFGPYLKQVARKKIKRRTIQTRTVQTVEGLDGCQLVFIAPSAVNRINQVLGHVTQRAVLTVADSAGALDSGAMINMSTRSGRVNFEVNLPEARAHGLKISSKLLRLAKRVVR